MTVREDIGSDTVNTGIKAVNITRVTEGSQSSGANRWRQDFFSRFSRLASKPWAALISPLLLLALWQANSLWGWLPLQILPAPIEVWWAAEELYAAGELQLHLGVSLWRLTIGFAIACVLGVAIGALLALSAPVRHYLGFTFEILRHIPTLILIPMLILLLGIGEALKLVIIVKAVFFPIAQATTDAVKNIPLNFMEVGQVYRLGRRSFFTKIILPATAAPILTGLRIGIGRAWLVLVAVELLAADTGVGQMMEFARQMMRLDIVMLGVLIAGLVGFVLDKSLRLLERYLLRWKKHA